MKKTIAKSCFVVALAFGVANINLPHKIEKNNGSLNAVTKLARDLAQFNKSYAGSWSNTLTLNITNNIRNAIGMIVGYGSHQSYTDFVCGTGTCSGPPENGIVGILANFVNELPTIGKSAGIASCELVPNSGSYTGTDSSGNSVTLTFQNATHSIPAGWIGSGSAFQHRVAFSANISNIGPTPVPVNIAYEFNCGDSAASYTAIGMDVDTSALPGYKRDIAIYNGPVNANENGIQLFMAEHDPADHTKIRADHAVAIHYNPTTNIFNIWGNIEGNSSLSNNNGFNILVKINGNGNYNNGSALMFAKAYSYNSANSDNTGKIDQAILTATGASDAGLESDPGNHAMGTDLNSSSLAGVSNGTPVMQAYEACINFTSPNTATAPSDASCSSYTLTAPADLVPAIDPTGDWSIHWALGTMASKLENI